MHRILQIFFHYAFYPSALRGDIVLLDFTLHHHTLDVIFYINLVSLLASFTFLNNIARKLISFYDRMSLALINFQAN